MKHRICAEPAGPPAGWFWWVTCGICGAVEGFENWGVAMWYLDLHVRVTHGA